MEKLMLRQPQAPDAKHTLDGMLDTLIRARSSVRGVAAGLDAMLPLIAENEAFTELDSVRVRMDAADQSLLKLYREVFSAD